MGKEDVHVEIRIFEHQEFGSVRTITEDGKTYFCGVDVAKALGYTNPRKAVRDHTRCGTKRSIPHPQAPDKTMEMTFVPEGDLYRLIMHSKLPSAERFESWVFDEVLPAIRRHGAYMTDSLLEQVAANPELILQLAQKLLEERQMRESLEHQLRAVQPKADYFDTFVNPNGCTNIRNTAKELEIPEREFISYLLEHHYLYRDKQDQLMPYAAYTKKEYFYLRDFYKPNGVLSQQTMFTCRGKNHIRRLIKGKEVR